MKLRITEIQILIDQVQIKKDRIVQLLQEIETVLDLLRENEVIK